MTLYVIRGDSVTAHSSAPAIFSQGELVVQSIEDIEASGRSKVELTAIWNALPGTAKLAKFKDRKTAAQRLWAAFTELPVEVPGSTAARAGSKQAQVIDLFRPSSRPRKAPRRRHGRRYPTRGAHLRLRRTRSQPAAASLVGL
jgi:hypothetical protein